MSSAECTIPVFLPHSERIAPPGTAWAPPAVARRHRWAIAAALAAVHQRRRFNTAALSIAQRRRWLFTAVSAVAQLRRRVVPAAHGDGQRLPSPVSPRSGVYNPPTVSASLVSVNKAGYRTRGMHQFAAGP